MGKLVDEYIKNDGSRILQMTRKYNGDDITIEPHITKENIIRSLNTDDGIVTEYKKSKRRPWNGYKRRQMGHPYNCRRI